jgi:hypothetical protein
LKKRSADHQLAFAPMPVNGVRSARSYPQTAVIPVITTVIPVMTMRYCSGPQNLVRS